MTYEFIPPKSVVIGKWYYGVQCPHCGTTIVLAEDLSGGEDRGLPNGLVSDVTCPHCQQVSNFELGSLRRFQARGKE